MSKQIDWQYIRICACYRMLKRGQIDQATAIQLMQDKGVKHADQTVSIWMRALRLA